MKEKIITLIKVLDEGNLHVNGPFYIDDIIVKRIRLCDGEPEFNLDIDDKCQFGEFEFWMIYPNMEEKHLEKILERLVNLI